MGFFDGGFSCLLYGGGADVLELCLIAGFVDWC